MKPRFIAAIVATLCLGVACSSPAPAPPAAVPRGALPSWNDGPSKKALTSFVTRVTTDGGADFVPGPERIAVFDNDGTLWAEQPMYVQLAFALDRVKALAPQHPEWQTREPFKSVLAGDMKGVMAGGEHALLEIIAASHAGNTTVEFEQVVKDWVATAKHPKTGRLVHRDGLPTDARSPRLPARERLQDLYRFRRRGRVHAAMGGEGVRHSTRAGGGQPQQDEYEVRNGVPVIARLAEIDLVDDKAGKPLGIQQVIGRRPTLAFGNSDGDFEMLEWTTTAPGPRLGVIVHHTDAEREWAYDRESTHRTPRAWSGRGRGARLGGRRHEAGVGADLPVESPRCRENGRPGSRQAGRLTPIERLDCSCRSPLQRSVVLAGGSTPRAHRRPHARRRWSFSRRSRTSRSAPGPAPPGMVWIPGGEFSMGAAEVPGMNSVGMQATDRFTADPPRLRGRVLDGRDRSDQRAVREVRRRPPGT